MNEHLAPEIYLLHLHHQSNSGRLHAVIPTHLHTTTIRSNRWERDLLTVIEWVSFIAERDLNPIFSHQTILTTPTELINHLSKKLPLTDNTATLFSMEICLVNTDALPLDTCIHSNWYPPPPSTQCARSLLYVEWQGGEHWVIYLFSLCNLLGSKSFIHFSV